MKNVTLICFFAIISSMMLLTGCEIIGDILEVGVWIGVIIAALVIGVIWWIIRKVGGK